MFRLKVQHRGAIKISQVPVEILDIMFVKLIIRTYVIGKQISNMEEVGNKQ